LKEAQNLSRELLPYEKRALVLEKLKKDFKVDPLTLSKVALVAETSAAIQRAATSSGVQIGPIRESPAHASGKELSSMQIEGLGQAQAVIGLIPRLEALGYPLVIDSVQITPDPTKPGMVKINLTIVVLDVEQWKPEEDRNV